MSDRPIPKALRWFYFVIGVGSLMSSGIYLGTAVATGGTGWRFLRAIMFLLLGLFFMLMYGENKSERGARSREAPGHN